MSEEGFENWEKLTDSERMKFTTKTLKEVAKAIYGDKKEQEGYYKKKREEVARHIDIPEEEAARFVVEENLKPTYQDYKEAVQNLAEALAVIGKEEGPEVYKRRLRTAIESLLMQHLPLDQQLEELEKVKKHLPTTNKLLRE